MRKQKYKEQECRRRYYFFDYLFWLGEITWENYHKVNFKQPRGSDMLWACIVLFIFIPLLAIAGLFLHDLAFEVFGVILVIVFSVSVIMTDHLFGKYTRLPGGKRSCSIMRAVSSVLSDVTCSFLSLFTGYSRNGFISNRTEMDK